MKVAIAGDEVEAGGDGMERVGSEVLVGRLIAGGGTGEMVEETGFPEQAANPPNNTNASQQGISPLKNWRFRRCGESECLAKSARNDIAQAGISKGFMQMIVA